jgi:spore coat protein CotF
MIPVVPIAERVVVEMISTELVPAYKPVVSTNAALTEMSSAMVGAGNMTVSTAMTTTDVSTRVATTMMASGVASSMATMTAATVTTTAVATMTTALAP